MVNVRLVVLARNIWQRIRNELLLKLSEKDDTKESKEQAKKEDKEPPVSFLELYKYATGLDKWFIFMGSIFSVVGAVCEAAFALTFGDITSFVVNYTVTVSSYGNITDALEVAEAKQFLENGVTTYIIHTCSLGVGIFILTYIATVLSNYSAIRQTSKIRNLLLDKILNQDISWYDVHQTGDFSSRIADDLKKVREGITEVSTVIHYKAVFIFCIAQGLIKGWLMTLICMVCFPVTAISMGMISWISSKLAKQEMDAYGEAGSIAEETLSYIRTVVAFSGQAKEEERYEKMLILARNNNIKRSFLNGISNGTMWLFTYASYSLAFWYGVKLFLEERHLPTDQVVYDAGTIVTVFFSVLTGTWHFSMASPYIETVGIARGAAAKIFSIIASEPTINASKGKGIKADKIEGNIAFKNVHFTYPSRPNIKILKGLNLNVKSGETVALVGSSGCGKSTCIQLIQRFYDSDAGEVYVDGNRITELDLTWLRSNIGVVGQEPVLFEATIAENIRYGCETATQEEIERAAKKANAHTFICALPQGYDTLVGERGAQLSGGQKQRIAIARALVRKPAILLLDEATSALDTNSEAVVQAALDEVSNECTTIVVAHRWSTVRKADRIVVISEGQVQEQGSHDELLVAKGAYFQLIIAQISSKDDEVSDLPVSVATEKVGLDRQQSTDTTLSGRNMSYSVTDAEAVAKEAGDKETSSSSLWAIMKFNSPEWWVITIGCISSVITGAGMPIYAIVFGNVMGVLSIEDADYVQREANKFAIFFLIIGIATGVATLLQTYMFGIAGEKLTMRLRSRMFKSILSQEMAWFDNKDHAVGALCSRLSGEAASVQGATGQRIGTMLNAFSTVVIALGVSFYFEWRVAFVALCFAPLIVLSVFLEQKIIVKEARGHYKSLQESTKIAVEAINGIRTLASLGCEKTFHERYMAELVPYQTAAERNTHVRGVVYGVSRSSMYFAYASAFYYGAILLKDEGVDYQNCFIVAECLLMSSWSLANALVFTHTFQKGLIAANRILDLLSRVAIVQHGSSKIDEKWNKVNIDYENVYFSYPTRPTVGVLKGLNLSVLQGKRVALVGPSGCGKSTIVQLLERFYDPTHGEVNADGKGIQEMHLSALRSHLGIVSQEPNLFSRTIADNIAYGDNNRVVSRAEVIDAAKKANIHNFITSLPLGYDTKLGEKGTQLSGGQKQRVAIARALVRNPKVLLLDEATSALDAESEKVVQGALDNAKVGRTCILIAHRLKTIQDADVICVINHGRVAEMGTHSELLSLKGLYYNLHLLQNG